MKRSLELALEVPQPELGALVPPPAAERPAPSRGGRQARALPPAQYEPGTSKIKQCTQCGTTRTPQWREGPLGPKTLCNACGVKRVRALKAMQQGKPASQQGKKQKGQPVNRTESIELAATLQLLAGAREGGAAPPPAKRQARSNSSGARPKRPKPVALPELADFDLASCMLLGSPGAALPAAVHKALAAMAAKASLGQESNPTDSGEEISWSPNNHEGDEPGRPPLSAAAAAARRAAKQQSALQRAAAAASANALLGGSAPASSGQQAAHLQLALLEHLSAQHQLPAPLGQAAGGGAPGGLPPHPSLAAAVAAAASLASSAGRAGTGGAALAGLAGGQDEADAVANLLSMSGGGPAGPPGGGGGGEQLPMPSPGRGGGGGGVRELLASLAASAGGGGGLAPRARAAGAPGSRPLTPLHARLGGGGGSPAKGAASGRHSLRDDDLVYLMGPGMPVVASNCSPGEMLEVVRLTELLADAQRRTAAAEAAVAAVDKILREKRAAATAASGSAIAAARRLHAYVSELNATHSLVAKATAAEQQQAAASHATGLALLAQLQAAAAGGALAGGAPLPGAQPGAVEPAAAEAEAAAPAGGPTAEMHAAEQAEPAAAPSPRPQGAAGGPGPPAAGADVKPESEQAEAEAADEPQANKPGDAGAGAAAASARAGEDAQATELLGSLSDLGAAASDAPQPSEACPAPGAAGASPAHEPGAPPPAAAQ